MRNHSHRSSSSDAELGQLSDISEIVQLRRRLDEELQRLEAARIEYMEMTYRLQRKSQTNQESALAGLFQSFGLGDDHALASQGGGCIISNVFFHKGLAISPGQGWGNLIRQASCFVIFISLLLQNIRTVRRIMLAPNVGFLPKLQLAIVVLASFGFAIDVVIQWWSGSHQPHK